MGKCVSKHPSAVTLALSDKDLARANQIWSKFAESSEYLALGTEAGRQQGNQLCEYFYVSNKAGDTTIEHSHEQQQQQQQQHNELQLVYHQQHGHHLQHHQQSEEQFKPKTLIKNDDDSDDDDDDDDDGASDEHVYHGGNGDDDADMKVDNNTKNDVVAATSYAADDEETKASMPPMAKMATLMAAATAPTIVLLGAKIDDADDTGKKQKTTKMRKEQKEKRQQEDNKQAKADTSRQLRHIVGNSVNKQWQGTKNNKSNKVKYKSNVPPQDCILLNIMEQKQEQQQKHHQQSQQQKPQQKHHHHHHQTNIIGGDPSNNEMVNIKKSRNINSHDSQPITVNGINEKSNLINKHHENHHHHHHRHHHRHHHHHLETVDDTNAVNIDFEHKNDRHIDGQHQHLGDLCESKIYYNIWSGELLGQSESKKLLKKHGGSTTIGNGVLETKGTAMSFGFRKKINTTPKKSKKQKDNDGGKKQDKCNNITGDNGDTVPTTGDKRNKGDGIGGRAGTVIDTESYVETNDNNGNTEQLANIHFEKVGAAVAAKTAQSHHNQGASLIGEHHAQQQQHRPGAGNRFGFKGSSIVRPASTGITPRYQSGDEQANLENNNMDNAAGSGVGGGQPNRNMPYKSNLKRRSKSAHSARSMTSNQCGDDGEFDDVDKQSAGGAPKIAQPKTITFNLNHNTIEYQRRQFFEQTPPSSASSTTTTAPTAAYHYNIINTGHHTNAIVRPLPRPAPVPAAFTKFTLQTTSLPKPEYPVPIRLTTVHSATTSMPMTVATSYPAVAAATGARAKDSHAEHIDQKTAKQMANNTRRGFNGSREISADSGIASLDITLGSSGGGGDSSTSSGGGTGHTRHSSPKRSRSRPRNLQMVMNGRHKFEVRDLDDPLSSESSLVEPLSLPKLPSEHQTVPLPLSGLVRSNTVLSREAFMQSSAEGTKVGSSNPAEAPTEGLHRAGKHDESETPKPSAVALREHFMKQNSDDTDSIDEEKLHIDRSTSEKNAKKHYQFRDINTYSSKNSSATSSRASSWCNAGESMAIKDCSSLSISSSEDSNKLEHKLELKYELQEHLPDSLNDDDLSTILNTDMQISSISSLTESLPVFQNQKTENIEQTNNQDTNKLSPVQTQPKQRPGIPTPQEQNQERPLSLFYSSLNESKFAEIAAAGSEFLLDDETSPTDSLVSSTDSDDAACKRQKHKTNEEIQEKDIDEISPELDLGSPISPGTPTHASHSLSLSDCGNLIDDEIADQPALLFNNDGGGCGEHSAASHKGHADTPTLMETAGGSSIHSLKSQSKARTALQQAIELSLRTPMSLRQAVLNRAESLDTLSPCESICSDDLMMDFDVNSSLDSIDKSTSIKSRSGSDLNKMDESHLFGELERKGSDVIMKELNTILRVHTRNAPEKDSSVTAHLPARATRLLNRSRLQQQCQINNVDSSESPKSQSNHSGHQHHHQHQHRRSVTSRGSGSNSSLHHSGRETHSSSDDLMLYDKSFRNAMIQDVLQFKRQLLRLRRILQETETLNPFESDNGQLFASCGLDSKLLEDIDLASLTSSTTDDPLQELADLRRQVVYLQGQVDDRDRTIRLQRNLIEKLEAEKGKPMLAKCEGEKEVINTATQTERTRPLSIGPDGLSRSKLENTSYTTYFPLVRSSDSTIILRQQQQPHSNPTTTATNQTRRHTIISTTFTNYNHLHQQQQQQQIAAAAATSTAPRRASISWESQTRPALVTGTTTTTTTTPPTLPTTSYKPVKITLIGDPLQQPKEFSSCSSNNRLNGQTQESSQQQQKLTNGYSINNSNSNNNKSNSNNHSNGSFSNINGSSSNNGSSNINGFGNTNGVQQHAADFVCRKNVMNGNGSCGQEKIYQNNNGIVNGKHNYYEEKLQQQQKQQQQQPQLQQYQKINYNNTLNHKNSSTNNSCKPQQSQPTVTIV